MSPRPVLPRVRVLDPAVANQIAAGEVVERPASVLKELIENSLDARATTLTIDLEQGGSRLIRVRDDGVGVHPDDLGLALRRHGTSKLARIEDLDRLGTLGFRGEALASIASVSRFTLRSRTAGHPSGWEISTGATGAQGLPMPAAMPPGTVVEVRDLFYNTPARRRFLRAERTELGHLETVLRHAALGRFDVGLVARHAERRLLSVRPAQDARERLHRVGAVLGRPFAERALELACEVPGMRLSGWLLPAAAASTTPLAQYLFLNGRAIRDATVRHALGAAYDPLLPPGHQPSYVLYLELPPDQVDVNVHPAKSEVRFRDARGVHDFVLAGVQRVLGGTGGSVLPLDPANSGIPRTAPAADPPALSRAAARAYPLAAGRAASAVRDAMRLYAPRGPAPPPGAPPPALVVEGRYVLLEDEGSLVVLDAEATIEHAARFTLAQALEGEPLVPRPLLLPPARPVSRATAQTLLGLGPLLQRLGVVVHGAGEGALSLRQLPRALRRADPAALLQALASEAPADPAALVALLARAASAPAASEAETRADALEALAALRAAGCEPAPPWGRRIGPAALAGWLREGS